VISENLKTNKDIFRVIVAKPVTATTLRHAPKNRICPERA